MSSDLIINVNEADFEAQVLLYSQEIPVVVDFWAVWCAPCRILGPILEKLAIEAQGDFRLAKVNVDENQNLARRFQIRSIPAIKVFNEGRIVSEFTGMRPEPQIKEFIRSAIPNQSDLLLSKALSLLEEGRAAQAELAFREVLDIYPNHAPALLGLTRSLLYQGIAEESFEILATFPASTEMRSAEILRPLARALTELTEIFPDDPLEAAYLNSLRLVRRGKLMPAMDGLLDILRQDKRYRNGDVRKMIVAIFEVIGEEDPEIRKYRSELASVLY